MGVKNLIIVTFCVVLMVCVGSAQAATPEQINADAYHTWLNNELETRFNLTGGTPLFYESETDFWDNATIDTMTHERITIGDEDGDRQMPFGEGVSIGIETLPRFLWSEGMWVSTQSDVEVGDNVLLTFWTRSQAAQIDGGMVSVAFEQKETWLKSLHWTVLPTENWEQHYLPFTITESDPAGNAHISFQFGAQIQTIEIAGVAAVNYGDAYDITELPIDLINFYEGQEADADWRVAAAERIENHRKSDLSVIVRDRDGQPIRGAEVAIEMQNHAFQWGTAVQTHLINGTDETAEMYREKLLDLDGEGHRLTWTVPENALKWKNWELDSNYWVQDETAEALTWLDENGFMIHGHSAIWGSWAELPDDLKANWDDFEYVEGRIHSRIEEVLTDPRLEMIDSWDILNEGRDTQPIHQLFSTIEQYPSGTEQYADWFSLAHDTAPNIDHHINDFSILSVGGAMVGSQAGYERIIADILAADVELDAIGMQSHIFYPPTPPERLVTVLDDFAQFDVPIHITEYDITVWDENLAADYTRDFLTVLYSHPAVDRFVMWGFYDGTHWLNNSPMFRTDWSLKPAGEQVVDLLFNEWWTDEVGTTRLNGRHTTSAFHGDYTITVSYDDVTKQFSPTVDTDRIFTVELDVDYVAPEIQASVGASGRLYLPFLMDTNSAGTR